MDNNELRHHGVVGMKWGVRRYQNRDGTLTAAGKKRYDKEMARLKEEERVVKNKEQTKAKLAKLDQRKAALDDRKKALDGEDKKPEKKTTPAKQNSPQDKKTDPMSKPLNELTDEELRVVVNRMNLEDRYRQLNPPQLTKGQKFMNSVRDDVVAPVAKDLGRKLLKSALEKAIDKAAGSVGKVAESGTKESAAKKTADTVEKQAKKAADTVKRNYDKAKSKYESPTVNSKTTWVNDDDWWNTPGPRDTSTPALPPRTVDTTIGKKKKRK